MNQKLYLDIETSFVEKNKKFNPSPYIPENEIVSIGLIYGDEERYLFYDDPNTKKIVQEYLDKAKCVVAFNSKFDMSWLLEIGHTYTGPLWDPMVVEYILARGQKLPLSLEECLRRRGLPGKELGVVEDYLKQGIHFGKMPKEVVQKYGMIDTRRLKELDEKHAILLAHPENMGLLPTIKMSNDFIWCLIEMERNGIHIDTKALDKIEVQYKEEYESLKKELEDIVHQVMGDTPINLDSPEQLSWLIYSRKVTDKDAWADVFNIGMEKRGAVMKPKRRPRMHAGVFVSHVRSLTSPIYRTRAEHCDPCSGKGVVNKIRVDGTPFKKSTRCGNCGGQGYVLVNLPQIAGFKLTPTGPLDVSAGGFATDKETIESLRKRATGVAKTFLDKISRFGAVGTYRDTFCAGIRRGLGNDNILHTQLMQCITATGRLSSQQPNFQNMPRANTFPVRGCVSSRFDGGSILEVDFAKLEYATAVFLAQDKAGINDIEKDIDAHTLTSQVLTGAGQNTNRQDAKPHTFKPLYGGSSGTEAEQEYYTWFKEKHADITAWQEKNKETVLATGKLKLPSGREYVFVGTKRLPNGYVTNSTQICNYPVQGFATGDVVPCVTSRLYLAMRNTVSPLDGGPLRSLLILTVHDSIVFDVYPGEEAVILSLVNGVFSQLGSILSEHYDISINVPFGWEVKSGPNWLHMRELYKDSGKDALRTFNDNSRRKLVA